MINKRQLFFDHLAQTSDAPAGLEIVLAEGVFLYTADGKRILDLISGVSVNNVGHRHPAVVEAIKKQCDQYLHLMVYGELIQTPQVLLAAKLKELLPEPLSTTYLVNSGSEANEGALKLAKKYTGRSGIIGFENAYHGSTHGCLSVIGGDYYQQGYGPLLSNIKRLPYNDLSSVEAITTDTAAVIIELVQGEGGIIGGAPNFIHSLRKRCTQTGTLLIVDEVQTGFGRTGKLFAFEHYPIVPDILTLAKGMGGGMPIGAFISSAEIMNVLQSQPALGHITTFGGHPVSSAAALAALNVIIAPGFIEEVAKKGEMFRSGLSSHPAISSIRRHGLLMACVLKDIPVKDFITQGMKNGILSDWFLFCDNAFRVAPPLTISYQEIDLAIHLITKTLNELNG